ncbi:hypothetical protein K2173_028509 [Erythroxylum novogranatense]|uniref:Ubiquitin-like protease family profile domain-containing protein n=1 Tax=Erythroxylum novogranatense TaxID=1862640 RepID=A0AAV8U202_9ROSI|nr:hypothetical protein K2173_028509 [Erythroxylum novogranatense]
MKNNLEIFDFKEEDDLAEITAGKLSNKLKNPNLVSPAILKCDFLEHVDQGPDSLKHDPDSLLCVNVDVIDSDRSCDKASADAHALMMSEDFFKKEGNSGLFAISQSNCLILGQDFNSHVDDSEPKSSPEKCQSQPVDVQPDADGSMDESSPSSPTSDVLEDGVDVNNGPRSHCSSGSETDDIDIAVDYFLYRQKFYSGCLVTFSSCGIKIDGLTSHPDQESLSIELGIDDMIHVESYNLEKFATVTIKIHILSKDAVQVDNAHGASVVEELEFAAFEPNWIGMWEHITSLNTKYFAVWRTVHDTDVASDGRVDLFQQRPYFPNFDEAFEDMVYPQGDSDAVSISKRDVDLLQPETFINDTIIDFYIKYLKNQIPAEEKHRFHFFNSFFFRKLADLDKDPSSASDGRAAFLRVRKWTRKVDLFGKDYVFIPVNFNLHWSLLVVCHPGEVADFKDKESGKSLRVPCILHMDSIKGTHAGLKNLVQSYFWEEWKERHKETLEDFSSKFLNLRFVPLELPQQENMFDCGLFLLHYLELFLLDAPLDFNPFKIDKFSKFLNVDWFTPSEASLKRTLIQRLISEILQDQFQQGECGDELHCDLSKNDHKDTGREFVSEGCTPTVSCQIANSEADHGIEITLLDTCSVRNSECVNDSGLVVREFFEPGVTAGSLLAQCSSFDQPSSYYRLNSAVAQIEDGAETAEQLLYYSSGEPVFHQIAGMTPPSGSIPFSYQGFGGDPSWNPEISMQREKDGSPSETSISNSDDSEIGIIENDHMEENVGPSQNNIDEQRYASMDNMDCLTDGRDSTSNEFLGTSTAGMAEDGNKFTGSCENHSLASCPDDTTVSLPQNESPKLEGDGKIEPESIEVAADDVKTIDNEVRLESKEKQDLKKLGMRLLQSRKKSKIYKQLGMRLWQGQKNSRSYKQMEMTI